MNMNVVIVQERKGMYEAGGEVCDSGQRCRRRSERTFRPTVSLLDVCVRSGSGSGRVRKKDSGYI